MVIKRSRPILRYVWQSGLVGWGWMLEVGVDSEGGWKLNVRLEGLSIVGEIISICINFFIKLIFYCTFSEMLKVVKVSLKT